MQIPDERIQFVDIPELAETFADSVGSFTFDGQALRVEFCVTRHDQPKPPQPPSARRYPACRLVLTPEATVTFALQLQGLLQQLEKQGSLVARPPDNKPRH